MSEFATQTLYSLAVMLGFGMIPLVIYALRSVGVAGFTLRGFLLTNRLRFVIGLFLMALISVLVTLEPESRRALSLAVNFVATFLGINGASSTDFGIADPAIGLIVGGLLVAAISGKRV